MKEKFTKGYWQLKQNENCKHKDLQVWTKHGYMVGTTVIKVDETRLDGESWLDMRDRTEEARELAKEEANANVALMACAPYMYKHIEEDIEILQRQARQYVLGSHELRAINLRIETKQKLLKRARG